MGEGKKIVVEHYPAERLPADLQRAVGGAGPVRITVGREAQPPAGETVSILDLLGAGSGCYAEDEVVSDIRKLRDES